MANPIPMLKFQAFDSSGAPLSSGKLYTYEAGTTTPKTTYTDSTLGTPNANPVILDSRGEANVWLSGGYKFILKDSADVTIYTVDNITDALANTTISGTLTISSTAVTWSGNPTHSGNHTFSGNVTVQGNTALGNAGTDTVTTTGNVVHGAPTSGATVTSTSIAGGGNVYTATDGTCTSHWASLVASGMLLGTTTAHKLELETNSAVRQSINSAGNHTFSAPSSGTTATVTISALSGAAPLKLGTLTVANLPAAATAGAGSTAFVTDANATTHASVVAGGGSNGIPVYCDGTNWRIG